MAAITASMPDIAPALRNAPFTNVPDARAPIRDTTAMSWGAILAGAAAAAALSLILLILGMGLGLSSISPWAQTGATATVLGVSTILWITFTQLSAAGMGGYLSGRLRTKWPEADANEVYFRDTAHGFLAWAVATLVTAALLSGVIGSIIGSGVRAGSNVAGAAVTAAATGATTAAITSPGQSPGAAGDPMGYFVDVLFREALYDSTSAARPAAGATTFKSSAAPPIAEVARVLAHDLDADTLPADDVRYLGALVARHTGMPVRDAEQRVVQTHARMKAGMRSAATSAKRAADDARKASAWAALWLFVSLLAGAFVASLAATYGGRQRDL